MEMNLSEAYSRSITGENYSEPTALLQDTQTVSCLIWGLHNCVYDSTIIWAVLKCSLRDGQDRPVFCLQHDVSETGFCFRLQVEPTQLSTIDRASFSLSGPDDEDRIQSPKRRILK
jgi:hypothetical protein